MITTAGTDVHVWCVTLRRERDLVARARALLGPDERRRADAFSFEHLGDDFAISRATMRALLSTMVGTPPADLRFSYGPYGKPSLAGDGPGRVEFNASHSGDIFACAVTRDRPLGIDVERSRRLPDYARLAQRFFSAAEYRDLMTLEESLRPAAFYACWSRKEAFIKALGGGLSIPLDSFRVSLTPGRTAALLEVRGEPAEAAAWTIRDFLPDAGYAGAIAIRDRSATVHLHHADAAAILDDARVP